MYIPEGVTKAFAETLINSAIQSKFAIVKFEITVITPAAKYPVTLRVIGTMRRCCYVIYFSVVEHC